MKRLPCPKVYCKSLENINIINTSYGLSPTSYGFHSKIFTAQQICVNGQYFTPVTKFAMTQISPEEHVVNSFVA